MVNCIAALNDLAAYYAGLGDWVGLATGAPGATAAPANEASGGTPAYARVQTTWSAGATGVQAGSPVNINVAPGTYTDMLIASAATGTTMTDNGSITPLDIVSQGVIVLSPTYTQT